MEERGDLTSTRAAEGMAKGNGTTEGIDLLERNAELLDAPEGLAGKGLVDLEHVNVANLEARLLNGHGDGIARSDAHDVGRNANNRVGEETAEDGKVPIYESEKATTKS